MGEKFYLVELISPPLRGAQPTLLYIYIGFLPHYREKSTIHTTTLSSGLLYRFPATPHREIQHPHHRFILRFVIQVYCHTPKSNPTSTPQLYPQVCYVGFLPHSREESNINTTALSSGLLYRLPARLQRGIRHPHHSFILRFVIQVSCHTPESNPTSTSQLYPQVRCYIGFLPHSREKSDIHNTALSSGLFYRLHATLQREIQHPHPTALFSGLLYRFPATLQIVIQHPHHSFILRFVIQVSCHTPKRNPTSTPQLYPQVCYIGFLQHSRARELSNINQISGIYSSSSKNSVNVFSQSIMFS